MVRIKNRYLLLNILYPDTQSKLSSSTPAYLEFNAPTPQYVSQQAFLGHVRNHVAALFGEHGLGVTMSSLKVVYFSHATSTAILRVPREHFRLTWAALTLMNELPLTRNRQTQNLQCVVRVVRVSGTIKKAEEELLRRSRREIVKAKMLEGNKHETLLDRLTGGSQDVVVPPRSDQQDHATIEDPENDTSSSE